MAKSNRPEINIRRGRELGDRLVFRNPGGSAALRDKMLDALRPHGIDEVPSSISVGHFIELEDPDGAPAFMTSATANAAAALSIEMVQRRIGAELAKRIAARLLAKS